MKRAKALKAMYKKDRQAIADVNPVGSELSNAPGQDPRALIEERNNQLAQELLKKQNDRIKAGK